MVHLTEMLFFPSSDSKKCLVNQPREMGNLQLMWLQWPEDLSMGTRHRVLQDQAAESSSHGKWYPIEEESRLACLNTQFNIQIQDTKDKRHIKFVSIQWTNYTTWVDPGRGGTASPSLPSRALWEKDWISTPLCTRVAWSCLRLWSACPSPTLLSVPKEKKFKPYCKLQNRRNLLPDDSLRPLSKAYCQMPAEKGYLHFAHKNLYLQTTETN